MVGMDELRTQVENTEVDLYRHFPTRRGRRKNLDGWSNSMQNWIWMGVRMSPRMSRARMNS